MDPEEAKLQYTALVATVQGPYFQVSFDYAKTLKPKATRRKAKP
jgi:hypothetical protein